MTVIKVFVNHGRLLATCPKCGQSHVVEQSAKKLICASCWRGLRAEKFEPDQWGAIVSVPHVQKIFATQDEARAAGEEYDLEAVPDWVMPILRQRQAVNMNWTPQETREQLEQENADHGLEGA